MNIKTLILLSLILASQVSFAANYRLLIDGEVHDLDLEQETSIKIGQKNVSVLLEKNNLFLFSSDTFSFEHPNQYLPSKIDLGENIYQTSLVTPMGGAVLIQEFLSAQPPANIIDMMITEVTREEQGTGYKIESKDYSFTLPDGKVLNGKEVTSNYRDYNVKRHFYTYSFFDSGFCIMTQSFYESGVSADAKIIDAIIESLKISAN